MERNEESETERVAAEIVDAAVKVHRTLGPGFLEGVYQNALRHELALRDVPSSAEVFADVHYEDQIVGRHRFDLVVGNVVIVELKTAEALTKAHYAQLRSYLRAANLSLGLLINFAGSRIDIRRVAIEP